MTIHAPYAILYLHGFRSSPASSKAMQLNTWLAEKGVPYACPALDIHPRQAMAQALEAVEAARARGLRPRLIGSSLGGFYASCLMETHPAREEFKACLINPACYPGRDLAGQIGRHKAWHSDEWLEFTANDVTDLTDMAVGLTSPERYLLVAATGDELLDWREMVDHYPGAQHRVVQGSDHGLSDFADHWPCIQDFLLSD